MFEPFMPSLSAKINLMLGLENRSEEDDQFIERFLEKKDYLNAIKCLKDE